MDSHHRCEDKVTRTCPWYSNVATQGSKCFASSLAAHRSARTAFLNIFQHGEACQAKANAQNVLRTLHYTVCLYLYDAYMH